MPFQIVGALPDKMTRAGKRTRTRINTISSSRPRRSVFIEANDPKRDSCDQFNRKRSRRGNCHPLLSAASDRQAVPNTVKSLPHFVEISNRSYSARAGSGLQNSTKIMVEAMWTSPWAKKQKHPQVLVPPFSPGRYQSFANAMRAEVVTHHTCQSQSDVSNKPYKSNETNK